MPILPTINASLNFCAAVCLVGGWLAIRRKDRETHQRFMIMALVCSFLFLISYVTYHYLSPGITHYQHRGILRIVYFTILLTHTPLAMVIVPFSIAAVYFAAKKEFSRHTRITRWLIPVWIYVSVTGVVIYLMLYIF